MQTPIVRIENSCMRQFIVLLAMTLSVIGCSKKSNNGYEYTDGTGLTGKWVATEQYINPGNGGWWNALAEADQFTVEFLSDSSFRYSPNFPMKDSLFNRYGLNDRRILMHSTTGNARATWYHDFDPDGRLQLSVFLCFEGCAYGLRRIK